MSYFISAKTNHPPHQSYVVTKNLINLLIWFQNGIKAISLQLKISYLIKFNEIK